MDISRVIDGVRISSARLYYSIEWLGLEWTSKITSFNLSVVGRVASC